MSEKDLNLFKQLPEQQRGTVIAGRGFGGGKGKGGGRGDGAGRGGGSDYRTEPLALDRGQAQILHNKEDKERKCKWVPPPAGNLGNPNKDAAGNSVQWKGASGDDLAMWNRCLVCPARFQFVLDENPGVKQYLARIAPADASCMSIDPRLADGKWKAKMHWWLYLHLY